MATRDIHYQLIKQGQERAAVRITLWLISDGATLPDDSAIPLWEVIDHTDQLGEATITADVPDAGEWYYSCQVADDEAIVFPLEAGSTIEWADIVEAYPPPPDIPTRYIPRVDPATEGNMVLLTPDGELVDGGPPGGGGGSDYDGSATAAVIQALDPTSYLGQTWWATDEKIAYAAVTSPVVGADEWQAIGVVYDALTDTYQLPTTLDGQTQNIGREIFRTGINDNGTTATALNPKVFLANLVSGTNPSFLSFVKAIASDISHNAIFGLNTTDAEVGGEFKLATFGRLNGVNTSAWPVGTKLYVDATTRGEMTTTEPLINAWQVAEVFVQDAVNGVLNVNTINATDLADTGSQVLQGVNVWFTGDETTLTGGTFYDSLVEDQGTVADASQTQTVGDNEMLPLAQDWVTVANTSLSPLAPGSRSMIMEYQISSTGAGEKLHCEIYVADPDGNVVDSGIVGNPVGARGVRVLMDMESPVLNTPETNDTYFATLTTYLDEAYTLPDGYRLRFTILVEKIGTQGGGKTFTINFGNEHDTRIIGLSGISSDDVSNNAADSADNPTVTDALDNRVLKTGDTMTGALVLSGDPTIDLHAATKKYVDDNSGGGGNTYYTILVDEAGGGDYTTIGAALAAASAGDAIFIRNGIYEGGVTVSLDNITLIGESRDGVVIQSPLSSANCFNVTADDVSFDSFTIDGRWDEQVGSGSYQAFSGIYLTVGNGFSANNLRVKDTLGNGISGDGTFGRVNNVSISDCIIENISTDGDNPTLEPVLVGIQAINGTDNWSIKNNFLSGWSQAIGLWYGANNCTVESNRMVDNFGYSTGIVGGTRSTFEDYGATAYNYGNRLINNTIIGSTSNCIEIAQGTQGGMYSGNYCRQWNIFEDNTGGPFSIVDGGASQRTQNLLFTGNVFDGRSGALGVCAVAATSITIENNTFLSVATQHPIQIHSTNLTTTPISNINISNNTFSGCNGGIFFNSTNGANVISKNSFRDTTTTAAVIRIDYGSCFNISENIFTKVAGGASDFMQLGADCSHSIIADNVSICEMAAIRVAGNYNRFTGNVFYVEHECFLITGGKNTIEGNIIGNQGVAYFLVMTNGGAANNRVRNNIVRSTLPNWYQNTGGATNIYTRNHDVSSAVEMVSVDNVLLGEKTVGASEATIAHGLAYIPTLMTITMTSAGQVWQSTAPDITNIYLTADDADRTCIVSVL